MKPQVNKTEDDLETQMNMSCASIVSNVNTLLSEIEIDFL